MVNEESVECYDDERVATATTAAQLEVENSVLVLYHNYRQQLKLDPEIPQLLKRQHLNYLKNYMVRLMSESESLDCSRAWLCYWITHSLSLLKSRIDDETKSRIIDFLSRCQCPNGGFGGGPGQYAHLAPTYAAVNALCTLDTEQAYRAINREKLLEFLWSVRTGDGSFKMHSDGETDMRSVYCALVVAKLTNIYSPVLFENSARWVATCQSYEGGFSGFPGLEAHGGYSFCAIASLYLLSSHHLCDLNALLRWTANRQMKLEGGFQGRTNKLVDSCYSYWQGASMALVSMLLCSKKKKDWLFESRALQQYILICCQNCNGGMSDKPNVSRDPYHTCYALSGLSLAQNLPPSSSTMTMDDDDAESHLVGSHENLVEPINPVFNLVVTASINAINYFNSLDSITLNPPPRPPTSSSFS